MVYMISYDLHSPTQNRENVENSIKNLGTWCKYLTTTFLVKTTKGSFEVQQAVTKFLDSNDRMIICEINKPIQGWLSDKQWEWIHENL